MNCKRAKAEIALWVGGDLCDVSEESLRQHLGGCSGCHRYWQQMKNSLRFLQEPDEDSLSVLSGSVWPDLSPRLSARETMWRRGRFNGWIPAALIAASCVVILYSAFNSPLRNQSIGSPEGEFIPLVRVSQRGALDFPPATSGSPVNYDRGFQSYPRQKELDSTGSAPSPDPRPLLVFPLDSEN
ncbi:MAG: zf-HC2 domain-containing protein [Planctomycetes bacterium]|nr:zf-HC2 domain-containing protein [Planctomycetota bacterium]